MKTKKLLTYSVWAFFFFCFSTVTFLCWAIDHSELLGTPVSIYSAPKTTAQIVSINSASLHDSGFTRVGVRNSNNENWRQFCDFSDEGINDVITSNFGTDFIWSGDDSLVAISRGGYFHTAYDFHLKRLYKATTKDLLKTSDEIFQVFQKRGGWKKSKEPTESFNLSEWRWENADIKHLLRYWKH